MAASKGPGRAGRSPGKWLMGLLVLVAVVGVANRFISDDGSSPLEPPTVAARADLLPTRTPRPAVEPRSVTQMSVPSTTVPSSVSVVETGGEARTPIRQTPGFAPASWTDSLPDGAVPGTLSYIVDGDTYEIIVNGDSARYRLYRADTPEIGDRAQCGGASATEFVRYALSFDDVPDQVWIEGVDQRDKYGRKLAYLWFVSGGEPYLLNHVLINNGWAEDIDYGDAFHPYDTQLRAAASFAREHQLGVWAECGGFGIPLAQPTPVSTAAQAPMGLAGDCNPNYAPCIPNSPYDLDCKDVRMRVQVIGYDEYRLDGDGDGWGCESY